MTNMTLYSCFNIYYYHLIRSHKIYGEVNEKFRHRLLISANDEVNGTTYYL